MAIKFGKLSFSIATIMFFCGGLLCVPGLSQSVTNSITVNALVSNLIAENGGKTNKLEIFAGRNAVVREVRKDEEGAQVVFSGNQMEPLLSMLSAAYGTAPYIRTNNSGKSMFQYNRNQLGVGLSCTLTRTPDGPITHLIILGPKGLASLSGTSAEKQAPAAKSADEIRACDTAVKATVERGYKGDFDAVASRGRLGWLVGVFEKAKGPFAGSVATVVLKNDFTVVVFTPAKEKPE
jgi:hypothetical protein